MLKTLILIRHAKTQPQKNGKLDFERELLPSGIKDAGKMASQLQSKNILPEVIFSSTAIRALSTAQIFVNTFSLQPSALVHLPNLYMANESEFINCIKSTSTVFQTIALVAHNPGITNFANELTHVQIINMPTAGVFAISAKATHWHDFFLATKQFLFFEYPNAKTY